MELSKTRAVMVVVLLMLSVARINAQTWNEMFKQKQTQKKYLLEQVAALKLYAGYLQKGYQVVSTGLETVKDLSNGEFNLHNTFLNSLKSVNPLIRNSQKAIGIIDLQLKISRALQGLKKSGYLSPTARAYIESVRSQLLEECNNDLEELLLIITSSKVQMTDEERVKRLDRVYEEMRKKAAFTQDFAANVGLLVIERAEETRSINYLKELYEINH